MIQKRHEFIPESFHPVTSGSFIVSLNIEATFNGYNNTLNNICSDIENSTTFTFDNTTVAMSGYLTVDGQSYYGVSCGTVSNEFSMSLNF